MKNRFNINNDDSFLLSFPDIIASMFAVFILAFILNSIQNNLEIEKLQSENALKKEGLKTKFIIQDKILFPSANANIGKEGISYLVQLVKDSIINNPKYLQEESIIFVQGYTDNTPINTFEFPSNWELSAKRAINTINILTQYCGIPGNRLVVGGFSEFYPDSDNNTIEGKSRNRTIKLTIMDKRSLFNNGTK